jgi:hypothetical protein
MEKFSLKKLNKVEVNEQYHDEVSDRLQLWRILIMLGKLLRENIKFSSKGILGYYEL